MRCTEETLTPTASAITAPNVSFDPLVLILFGHFDHP
jgi:hypothetical protein